MSTVGRERYQLLKRVEGFLEGPMVFLGMVWLVLLVIELVQGSTPFLEKTSLVIWIIFLVDFALKFFIAPAKGKFLKSNIITIISLAVPAFRIVRVFRVLRLLRLSRGLRLVKVLGSLNRGMRALSAVMKRRAFGYIVLLTIVVTFAGAAGMYAFEKDIPGGLTNYGTALWWTSMIMTTFGSEYWPQTPEGRILCIFLSLFAFAVFGYLTATIATFFIGRDADDKDAEVAGSKEIRELKKEISELKRMIATVMTEKK